MSMLIRSRVKAAAKDRHRAMRTLPTLCACASVSIALQAAGAEAPAAPMTDAQRAHIEQQLQELRTERDEMSHSLSQFDARISALEAELHGTAPPAPAPAAAANSAAPAAPASAPAAAGTVQ